MRYRYVEFTRYLALDGVAAKPIQNLADVDGTPDAIGIVFAGGKRVPWGTIAYVLEEPPTPAALQVVQQPGPRPKR